MSNNGLAGGIVNGYNFTERVRKVLAFAREESQSLRHEYVGTEHILLGLLREGEGVAAAVLTNLDIDTGAVRARIEEVVKKGKAEPKGSLDLPYTSRAKKVLELSMAEARDLTHNYVGTEHLLLGLLREEKGIAAQVLSEAGLKLDAARAETLRLLGTSGPEEWIPTISPNVSVAPQTSPVPPRTAPIEPVAPPTRVASVKLEAQLKDGSIVKGEFMSRTAAINFLNRL